MEKLTPKIAPELETKFLGIAQKLIEVELMTREDEEEGDDAVEKTPEEIKAIAKNIYTKFID